MERWAALCARAGGVVVLGFALAGAARGLDTNAREILATGDLVEGFGRVGVGGFKVQGIDGSGRVLVDAQLSTAAEGLFWAGDTGIETVWVVGAPGTDPIHVGRAVTNTRGDVVASGLDGSDPNTAHVSGLYWMAGGAAQPLVKLGDLTDGGEQLCSIDGFAINGSGVLALTAHSAVSGASCDGVGTSQLYMLRSGRPHRIDVAFPSDQVVDVRLLGVAADGSAILDLAGIGDVIAVGDAGTRTVIANDVFGPAGEQIGQIRGSGSNALGDVAFWALADGTVFSVYRTDHGRIVRVVAVGDLGPEGEVIESIDRFDLQLGDRGDAVVMVSWRQADGTDAVAPLIVSADGTRTLVRNAVANGVAADGRIALLANSSGTATAARWQSDNEVPLLTAGDPAPAGGVFATGGISTLVCLGADGRVGAEVTRTDSVTGLVCGDASGFRTIARTGDPAPGGGRFAALGTCFLPGDGSVIFAARRSGTTSHRYEAAVYRARKTGIELVAAPGTLTADGGVINDIAITPDDQPGFPDDQPTFSVNEAGTVLLAASVDGRPKLLRATPGRPPAVVQFDLGGPTIQPFLFEAGIDADDRVFAVFGVRFHQTLAVSDGLHSSVLAAVSDLQLSGGPVSYVWSARAKGHRAIFYAQDAAYTARQLQYTPATGFDDVLTDQYPLGVADFTPQRTLIDEWHLMQRTQLLLDPDGLHVLRDFTDTSTPDAVRVNDRPNLLFHSQQAESGSPSRDQLAMSGPPPSAADCFAPPTAVFTDLPPPTPSVDTCDQPDCVHLLLGGLSGNPGEPVTFTVSLDSGPWDVAGVQLDLAITPQLHFAATDGRAPVCRVNPDINKTGTAFAFIPAGCEPDSTCTNMRALVLALDNVDPIPDGSALFECDAVIASDAMPGQYQLSAFGVGASDPNGASLPCGATGATLDVTASGGLAQQPGNLETGAAGGCNAVGGGTGSSGLLACAAALWLARRRRSLRR